MPGMMPSGAAVGINRHLQAVACPGGNREGGLAERVGQQRRRPHRKGGGHQKAGKAK